MECAVLPAASVANLEPARIRGIESQGMLLAADLGGRPIVATFEDVPVGTYKLEIESSKYAPFEKADVAIVERQLTDCGTVEVLPAGQVRGVVEDQDGKRAMSLVQCRAVGTEEWTRREMAMQGSYRLRGMAPGRYEIRAQPLGMQAGEPSQPIVVEVVAGKTKVADLKVTK